ncbi:MAG: AAA family ATPase, partial [Bowdeniella nasicola]|nr:AAA family ATPase [Bowdeniella nasicola]
MYGGNGSGKSCIARALATPGVDLEFLDENDTPCSGSDDTSNIYVFNEEYIDENLRQEESAELGLIVLLGKAAADANKEAKLTARLDSKHKELDNQKKSHSKAAETVKKRENEVKNSLRDTQKSLTSWRKRTSDYRSDGQYARLEQHIADAIIRKARNKSDTNIDDLWEKYNKCIETLNKLEDAQPISWIHPETQTPQDIQKIARLIALVSQTSGSHRSKGESLQEIVRNSNVSTNELTARLSTIFADKGSTCPTCFQKITKDFAVKARAAINEYLEETKNNQALNQLRRSKIVYPSIIEPPENLIDGKESVEELKAAQIQVIESV